MKLVESLSFQLALTYAGLFMASVTTLASLYYRLGVHRPLAAIRNEIRAESRQLSSIHGRVGPQGLVPILKARAGAPTTTMAYHALLRPDGSVVVTNLPSWPPASSRDWLRIDADVSPKSKESDYEALVLDQPLAGGGRLLIGRDIEDLEEHEEALAETAVWLLPALLILLEAGGYAMSRAIGRRIKTIDTVARCVIGGDLSERVPVRGTGDDIDRLSATLNLMLARTEAAIEAVRRVSDSVAHELRTPLMRLQAELVEFGHDAPGASRERMDRVLQEAERLSRMFDAILRISRIEAGSHAARAERVDLSALLVDAAELYQPAAEEKAIDLATRMPNALFVQGDADLLFQAISNLLDNAIKFTPPGGLVTVAAGERSGGACFTVTDTGPGIADDLHGKVTERFFRVPSAAGTPGFGLGLSLVDAIAAAHGSELRLTAAEPGLRVKWVFPRDR